MGARGMQFGLLFEVLVMAQAHSCKIDGRMQFGELMQLFCFMCCALFWVAVGGAADRVGACFPDNSKP